jgi:glycosyltransferase involved in cell wall biosynthesis
MNKICIVLCTYNGERFLERFLQSLTEQEKKADVIVAYDDGSTDSTLSILKNYGEKLPLKIFSGGINQGHRAAFNKALSLAKNEVDDSDFIALADQDDEWLPNKLKILSESIQDKALVFGDARVIDADGNLLGDSWRKFGSIPEKVSIRNQIAGINNVTGCLSLFKASLLDAILPIPESVTVHDRWVAMIAERRGGIFAIPQPVIRYRLHESNAVGGKPVPKMSKTLRLQETWVAGILENAERIPLTKGEILFAKRLLKLHRARLHKAFLPFELPWIFKNRESLFLPGTFGKRLRQILFSAVGLPLAKKIWNKS